jgi:hypothetical protein
MTTVISGSSPSITFSDATTQTTAANTATATTLGTVYAKQTTGGGTPYLTAFGYNAGVSTTGASNTAIGTGSLFNNGSGYENTAVGYQTLYTNSLSTGVSLTAIGMQAGYSYNRSGSNQGHVFVGVRAGYYNVTGIDNTYVGGYAGYYQTGGYNTALGSGALLGASGTSTGSNNVAVGYQALYANTSASSNTAVGYKSGVKTTSGTNNVFVGIESGSNNITGQGNTFVGRTSGLLSTGSYNTFVGPSTAAGESCGFYMTTGTRNTILGGFNGNQDGLDIRTLDYRVVISDGNGFPYLQLGQASGTARALSFDGAEFFPVTDNVISCGYSSLRWSVVYAATGTINTSDRNLKQDIAELDDAEKRVAIAIKSLIKKYRFKDSVAEKGDKARIHVGAIAQEVASAFEAEGLDPTRYGLFCSDTWYEVDGKKLNPGGEFYKSTDESVVAVTQLGLRYEELLAFVISAM